MVMNLELIAKQINELEEQSSDPELWNNQENAQNVTRKLNTLKSKMAKIGDLESKIDDLTTYISMIEESTMSGDTDGADTLEMEFLAEFESLKLMVDELEVETLLGGKYDAREAVITIRAGAGGVEAMDWTSMLLRMYTRWCESKGYSYKIEDVSYGEEAGIKSVTFEVNEPYAFGHLAFESGTHRLVRISPFNAQSKRQTSFAAVEVIPLIEDTDHIDIPDSEIKVDVFRASGPGGQSVNTTDSAVRLTHIPTGIVVSMQNEKSQIQNRAAAYRVLQSRLLLLKQEEEAAQKKLLAGDVKASWGDQVRNYVLQPYQMVKDTRTSAETAQTSAVLDGDIDLFIKSGIRYRANNA